jgi:hypothetical protein
LKKIIGVAILILVCASMFFGVVAAVDDSAMGPAPFSGDGVSEGSGFDRDDWQNQDSPGIAPGPAPNSGDGVPDGSGF